MTDKAHGPKPPAPEGLGRNEAVFVVADSPQSMSIGSPSPPRVGSRLAVTRPSRVLPLGRYRDAIDDFFHESVRGLMAPRARACQNEPVLEDIWDQSLHVVRQNVITAFDQRKCLRGAE